MIAWVTARWWTIKVETIFSSEIVREARGGRKRSPMTRCPGYVYMCMYLYVWIVKVFQVNVSTNLCYVCIVVKLVQPYDCMYVCIYGIPGYIRTYVRISECMYVLMFVCLYVSMYVCMYVYKYICMVCMYVCMHVCINVCMCVISWCGQSSKFWKTSCRWKATAPATGKRSSTLSRDFSREQVDDEYIIAVRMYVCMYVSCWCEYTFFSIFHRNALFNA